MRAKRITVFAGHYGSGKTSLAVAYARFLHAQGLSVTLFDLDIVNPYFRTADAAALLAREGIRLIASRFAGSNVDAPAVPAGMQSALDDTQRHAVIDLGGDDRGALALGRYARRIRAEGGYAMLMVINPFRPLTGDLGGLRQIRAEVEGASGVRFTGLVNCANLGRETTLADVSGALPLLAAAQAAFSLPLVMSAVNRRLLDAAPPGDATLGALKAAGEVFPVDLLTREDWRL